jgi:hypothetical protein
MANPPVPNQHVMVMQNQTTGAVDFLQFNFTQLVGSFMKDYGLSGWKIVASGDFNGDGNMDLVAQRQDVFNGSGPLDFLFLDAHANLVASAMTMTSVPFEQIHGSGFFGSMPGQVGPALVGQAVFGGVGFGGLNFYAFDGHGHVIPGPNSVIAAQEVSNTAGIPPMIGVISYPGIAGLSSPTDDEVVCQLANGSIDVLGFSGTIANGSLTMISSDLLPGTVGSPHLFALDQDFSTTLGTDANVSANINGTNLQTVEMVGVTVAKQPDLLMFNSGVNDLAHRGDEFGTLLENFVLPTGWQLVDAGPVAQEIFPLT